MATASTSDKMNENSVPQNAATDSIVLEEEIDPDYIPTDLEVEEYAKWLGIDTDGDRDMLWIAREGLMAPLPKSWKPCKTKDTDDIYYFNFETGESTWDHPCDGYYKEVYADERKKKEIKLKRERDEILASQAKQNMELLTGSRETKKPKKRPSEGTPSLIPTLDRSPKPVKGSSLPETNRSLGTAPQTSKISIGESHTSSFFEKSEPDNDQTVESRRNASKSAPPKSAGAPQEMSKQPQSDVNVTKSSVSSACPESDNEDKVPHSRADLGLGLKATRKLSTEGFSYEGSALENNDTGASSTPKAADKDDLQQLPSRRLQEGELDMEEWLLKEKHRNQMAELEQQFDKEEREFQEKMRIKRREMNRELEAFEIEYNQKILAGKAKLATTIEKDEKDRDTEKFQPLNNQVLFLTSKLRAAENAKLILENDMQSKEKDWTNRLNTLKESEMRLRSELSKQMEETKELQRQLTLLRVTNKEMAKNAAALDNALAEEKQVKNDLKKSHKTQVNELRQTILVQNKEILKESSNCTSLSVELVTLRSQLAEAYAKVGQLESLLSGLKEDLASDKASNKAEYDRLETELQRVLIDKAFLEEQLRQANKSIDLLSRSNALNSDSEASESTQEEKRSPGYKSLLSVLEVTKTNLSNVTKELETEKLRADSLHNEVLFMRRSVEEDRKEKLVLHAVLVEKDTLYFSLEDENKKREQSLLTEYEAIIMQKEAQLADVTQELTNKVSELASLTTVVEEDREKIIMLRSEMAAAIKTTKLYQKESGDLREQLQHTTSLLDVEKKRAIKENTTMAALNARLESEMKAKDAALATAQGLKLKEIQLQNALSAAEASIVELHASLMAAGDRETSLSSLLADLTAEASSLRLLVQSNFKDEMKTDLAGKEESGKDSITEKNHGEDLELEQEKEKRNHAPGPSMSQPATEVLKKGNSPFANKIGTPTTVMDEIETELAHGDDDNADNVSKIIGTFIADPTAVSAKNSKLKWIKRLIKEKALIDAAKSELDRETADLRSRQLKLLKVKELWKKQNEGNQSKRRGNENREQIVLINAKAAALNNRIETAKRVRRWIEERQKKLVLLERGMLAEDVDQENLDDDASVGSHARGNGLLMRLIKELDDDVSALESVVSSTPSTATPLSSERYRPRQASHRKYRSHSGPGPYAPPGYSRILYAHPPLYPPSLFYETMPETRGFFGVKPPIPQGILFNDEISGAFTTHNKRHHYKHGHWTAPIMAESEVSQEGYIGAASVPTAAENRRQLQEITNRMKASKEAYEGHANWLDNMRREIGSFDHRLRSSAAALEKQQ